MKLNGFIWEFYLWPPTLVISSFLNKTIMYYSGFSESNKITGVVRRYAILLESELSIVTGLYAFYIKQMFVFYAGYISALAGDTRSKPPYY